MSDRTEFRTEFDAPTVLADRCADFAGSPDEPGICDTCGWLVEEHPDLGREAVAA